MQAPRWQASTVPTVIVPAPSVPGQFIVRQPITVVSQPLVQPRYITPAPVQPAPVQVVHITEDKPSPGPQNDVILSPSEGEVLPAGCTKYWSPSQQMSYYLNSNTGQRTWRPEGTTHKDEMR
jgi:hypothetical protein